MQKGDKFTIPFLISQEIYKGFIALYGDRNPLHTDREFAVKNGFKEEVMHGNILNGFISYFVGECLPIKNVIIHSQSIKFSRPVFMNEILVFESIITDYFESVNTVEFKFSFKNESGKKVASGVIIIGLLI